MVEWVGVVGLGYVGLPVALAFRPALRGRGRVRHRRPEGPGTAPCHDRTGEQDDETLRGTTFRLTFDPAELRESFFVVTVPTPVDADNRPDLTPVVRASATVGRALSAGTVVVYGSTVCPGVTEEICGPLLERESGLGAGMDFTLGTRRSGSTRATRRTPWQHHDPRASVGAPAHRGDPRRGLDPDPVLRSQGVPMSPRRRTRRLRSRSFSFASGFGRGWPLGWASAPSAPERYNRGQSTRWLLYSPSRRSRAPIAPGSDAAFASSTIRSLYSALKRRRTGRSSTSESGIRS